MKRKQSVLLASLIAISTLTGLAIGVNFVQRTIHSTGTVFIPTLGLDAYWEQECNNPVSSIDWGTLEPGDQNTSTIYLKNTGNLPLALSMITQNWTPTNATTYIIVTWNRENATISVDQVLQADITIEVLTSVIGISDFSLDIVITGSE